MQVLVPLLAIVVILVASTESKPVWPDLYVGHYSTAPDAETSTDLKLQQSQVLHYPQHAYSPYYVYNVQTELNSVPAAVIAHGKPAISHIPAHSYYYGPAVYDFRFPFNLVFPTVKPIEPSQTPKPTGDPTAAPKPPTTEKEDGIEKLDNKVEPAKEMKKPAQAEQTGDDDSVVIESI